MSINCLHPLVVHCNSNWCIDCCPFSSNTPFHFAHATTICTSEFWYEEEDEFDSIKDELTPKHLILVTAPLDSNILPGITRKLVLELAEECGIRVEEQPFTVTSLHTLDEVFVTSTIAEVLPVIGIEGHAWPDRTPGPISRQMQAAYREYVGRTCGV